MKAKFGKSKIINISEEEAIQNLTKAGYDFTSRPLFQDVPLSETSLDVSIIIPVYNSEHFLEKCLDSILKQDTQYQYEVICVNDGSEDGSLDILNRYKTQYGDKLVVISQENQGISASRNRGIALAKGRYLGFMDNDDQGEANYMDVLYRTASQTNSDVVQIGYKVVDKDNVITKIINPGKLTTNDKAEIQKNGAGYIWSGIYRKNLLEKIRFPIGFWYEDMITAFMMLRQAKRFSVTNESYYIKLSHENNASKVLWNNRQIKCIDSYFLAKSLADYADKYLDMHNDEILFRLLCYEYLVMVHNRTSCLPKKLRESVFVLTSNDFNKRFLDKNFSPSYKFYKQGIKALKEYDFNKWNNLSKALTFHVNT